MLLKIELENFFSIKEKVCIDFRAAGMNSAKTRELSDNVFEWNGAKILKSVGLFGPNASGKSNIVKAIQFCCRMIIESHAHNEGTIFNFQPFKFDGYDQKPSRFLVDFVCDNVEYEYSFSLTRTKIVAESLYYYPNGKRAKIYTRDENLEEPYTFTPGIIAKPKDIVLNTSQKNLFLSRASSMNRELAQMLYKYFLETFLLGLVDMNSISIEQYFNQYKKVILEALSVCDTDICDIIARHDKVSIPGSLPFINGQPGMQMIDILRFQTIHTRAKDVSFDMDAEESSGTRNMFAILLRLLDVVKNKKSLMLDEFDASLHSRLSEFIIDLVHASERSQLLFTSHNTNLISMSRFRKDQIEKKKKKDDGSTEVYSLYDFKDFRETMDAEKGYLQGRFDAVPIVDTSVARLKQLMED